MSRLPKVQFRGMAKTACAAGMDLTRLDRLVGAWRGLHDRPLVVGYHRVVKDFDHSDALSISPMLTSARTFEQHLDWIGQRYRFVSLDELATRLESGDTSGRPVAAVTFDDGYMDVYQNALPILRRKGIPSAVFVVTDLVGTERLQLHDELHLLLCAAFEQGRARRGDYWQEVVAAVELEATSSERLTRRLARATNAFQATRAMLETVSQNTTHRLRQVLRGEISLDERELRDFRMLDWDMLSDMVAHGVTVGSHTTSHALLTNETREVVRSEVEGSRRELEERMGIAIRHFAYPDGRFDTQAIQAVADAGYRTAYTVCAHRDRTNPLLTISRRMLWEHACMDGFGRFSPAILSCQVNGIFDPADACRLRHWA